MIRVAVVDDHPVVREGLVGILSDDPDLQVVAQAETGEEATASLARTDADVVVLDIRLPGISGIDTCAMLLKRHPDMGIVILTNYPDERNMLSAFAAGARGFLLKEAEPSLLRQAIRSAAAGGTFVDPGLGARLVALATTGLEPKGPFGLTRREMRVLSFMPRGLTNREIGDRLGISEQTVKTHVRHILRKLRARDRAEAASIALRERLL